MSKPSPSGVEIAANSRNVVVEKSKGLGCVSRYLYYALLVGAFSYASGALRLFAEFWNNRVWLATSPSMSDYEWMNASAFETAGKTSAAVKRMIFPRPIRGSKQLLIRVIKAGGNPVDFKMRQNPWPVKHLPAISGLDFAGYVVEADPQSSFKTGQRVFGMLPTSTDRWGTFADYVVNDEAFTAVIPESMSFSEAAATPLAALTAMQALALLGPVVENQSILIHAGSGGVGTFAIQFAKKLLKLKVYTTSSNLELCKELGADRVINYKTERFESVEPSYDYVIDMIGGDYLIRGLLKTKKHYVSVLNSGWQDFTGFAEFIPVGEALSFIFINAAHYLTLGRVPKYSLGIVYTDGKGLAVIGELIQRGMIRVILDEEFTGLEDGARKVHDRLQSGRAKGKVTLVVADE